MRRLFSSRLVSLTHYPPRLVACGRPPCRRPLFAAPLSPPCRRRRLVAAPLVATALSPPPCRRLVTASSPFGRTITAHWQVDVRWSPAGRAVLIFTHTDVDASGGSYYGSTGLFLLHAEVGGGDESMRL